MSLFTLASCFSLLHLPSYIYPFLAHFGYLASRLLLCPHARRQGGLALHSPCLAMIATRRIEESPCVRRRNTRASNYFPPGSRPRPKTISLDGSHEYACKAAEFAFCHGLNTASEGKLQRRRPISTPVKIHSVRYTGPNALPLISRDITRRNALSWDDIKYGRPEIHDRRNNQTSMSFSASRGSSQAAVGSHFYLSRMSNGRLRKTKSMFGISNNPTFNIPLRHRLSKITTPVRQYGLSEFSDNSSIVYPNTPASDKHLISSVTEQTQLYLSGEDLAILGAQENC